MAFDFEAKGLPLIVLSLAEKKAQHQSGIDNAERIVRDKAISCLRFALPAYPQDEGVHVILNGNFDPTGSIGITEFSIKHLGKLAV